MPLSLVGFSGTAIELAPQTGKVIGFQNYELWMNDPPPRKEYKEPVEGLYLREDVVLERIKLGGTIQYTEPFSFQLSSTKVVSRLKS